MNPKLTAVFIAVLAVIMFGRQFFHQVPVGHVGVASFFGEVSDHPYVEGPHFPVNPLLTWHDMDVREKSTKLPGIEVPTRDQLLTKIDLSIQYRLNAKMAPQIFRETGDENQVIAVHMIPKVRSLLRELGTNINRAEDFFLEETRDLLASEMLSGLSKFVAPHGIIIDTVLVRGINLPPVLAKAIEQKKEREQAGEREKAELERFRTEQQQQVAAAQAKREAAEENAKTMKILAEAKAYEISVINAAASKNPAYVQLQALEALKKIAEDPSAKLYFMDGQSPQPLPLLHMGDQP